MTLEEYSHLKVGDKVWIVNDWWGSGGEYKAYCLEISDKKNNRIITKCECGEKDCANFHDLFYKDFYLTKSEAWQDIIQRYEERLEEEKADIAKQEGELKDFQTELIKAKKQEEEAKNPYIELAKVYQEKLYDALEKCGYKFVPYYKATLPCEVFTEEDYKGSGVDMALLGGERCDIWFYPNRYSTTRINKKVVFDTWREAEEYRKKTKEGVVL